LGDFIFINDFNNDGYADVRILRTKNPLQESVWLFDPTVGSFVEQ
jgi:hypothetical protein